jgi:hypothetical protein
MRADEPVREGTMTGFGLYEVLRIFLPGAVAAAVLDLMLRLVAGSGPGYGDGPIKWVVASLTGVNFIFVALVFGFLLYLADLPTKARVFGEGDPAHDIDLPSRALAGFLEKAIDPDVIGRNRAEWVWKRSLPIYFLLMDAHLPAERHEKVYYFGGLYKMYFDARLLTVAALAFGPALGLISGKKNGIDFHVEWPYLVPVLFFVIVIVLVGVIGEFSHARASIARRKHGILVEAALNNLRDQSLSNGLNLALRQCEKNLTEQYWVSLRKRVGQVSGLAVIIFLAQIFGWILAAQGLLCWQILGITLCGVSVTLWTAFELGPPRKPTNKTDELKAPLLRRGLRDSLLVRLGCQESRDTQYVPALRAAIDLSLMAAALAGAATLTIQQGRPPWSVLLWGGFAVVAILIMAIRKHEIFLLNSFNDQSTWLEVNREKVLAWARKGPKKDNWA